MTLREDRLIGGEAFRVGRDSLRAASFVGTFDAQQRNGKTVLALSLEGRGCSEARVHFEQDAQGAFRAAGQLEAVRDATKTTPDNAGKLEVPFERATNPVRAIASCSPGRALKLISSEPCSDGSAATVERLPDEFIDDQPGPLERYLVICGDGARRVRKTLYAVPELCARRRTR